MKTGKWPIWVVGPGRCGSSTVARLLHTRLGVCMGTRFAKPNEHNQRGYFEDLDFVGPNAVFITAPQDKRTPAAVARTAKGDPVKWGVRWFETVFQRVLDRQDRGTPWGLKDPTTCYFMHIYMDMMPDCRIIRCRRPLDRVVASTSKLYGGSRDDAFGAVADRENRIDMGLAGNDRPVLGINFDRQREDDELVDLIGKWLERTSADSEQEQCRPAGLADSARLIAAG